MVVGELVLFNYGCGCVGVIFLMVEEWGGGLVRYGEFCFVKKVGNDE